MIRHRADHNAADIAARLRAISGVTVISWNGPVDLVVGYQGRNYLLEIKNPVRVHRAESIRSLVQKRMRAEWAGQYAVVSSIDEARAVVGC